MKHLGRRDGAPAATMTWVQDVFGNAVATASFQSITDTLIINSVPVAGSFVGTADAFMGMAVEVSVKA